MSQPFFFFGRVSKSPVSVTHQLNSVPTVDYPLSHQHQRAQPSYQAVYVYTQGQTKPPSSRSRLPGGRRLYPPSPFPQRAELFSSPHKQGEIHLRPIPRVSYAHPLTIQANKVLLPTHLFLLLRQIDRRRVHGTESHPPRHV
jgi:hypothetical protein